MKFVVKALGMFKEQIAKLDAKSRRVVYDKIQLLKENPYRYKRIRSRKYARVFRVRLSIQSKEVRLIYVVIAPNILLVCLLDRKKGYKDLEKYLSKVGK